MERRLYKDQHRKMIGGVCAGLAEYFNIDVTIVRVLFLGSLILHGTGFLLYVILWICLPKKNYLFTDPNVDYKVPPSPFGNIPPQQPGDPFTGMMPPRSTKGATIAGAILIVIGAIFLLNEFDWFPDIDFELVWPAILVAVGLVLIFSSAHKHPWEHNDWNKTTTDKEQQSDNPTTL